MKTLLDLVGGNVASDEARRVLARFPQLRSEVEDLGPDAGIAPAHYLRSEADGVLIKCSAEGEVHAVFFMSEGKDGFEQFDGPLPGNLTFSSGPEDAIRAFGQPAYRREPRRMGSAVVGELLRFDWPDRSVHFLFKGDGTGLDLVTVMTARAVPGRTHGARPV
jgi:hypothetical protein